MKLTVLGCYGPYPRAKGACSGYLLEDSDARILIDCGNGTLSRLFSYCNNLNQLDAILVSHLHADHMSDLMVLRYAIDIGRMRGKMQHSVPLYLPASPKNIVESIPYNDAFSISTIDEEKSIHIKGINIQFIRTNHPVECYAMAFEKNRKKFVYSGDSKYFQGLIQFIRESDLFLCEGGILEKDRTDNTPHLSAQQAAQLASQGNIKRMILTHLWPEVKSSDLLLEAREHFENILEIAEEGKSYYI